MFDMTTTQCITKNAKNMSYRKIVAIFDEQEGAEMEHLAKRLGVSMSCMLRTACRNLQQDIKEGRSVGLIPRHVADVIDELHAAPGGIPGEAARVVATTTEG